MKVLVTGATGFIGNHLCKLLNKNGYSIVALVRPGSDTYQLQQLNNIQFVYGDIRSFESLNSLVEFPQSVLHLAADWSRLNPDDDKEFLSFLVNKGAKKIIFYSSVCAAGLDLATMPLRESDTPTFLPNDHYGKYKYDVELLIQSFIKEKNIVGISLRPTLVYGPGDANNISHLVKAVRLNKLSLWDNGKRIIAPCSIQNLNMIALLALEEKLTSGVYYAADGENLSTHLVTKTIAEKMGFKHRYTNWSSKLGYHKGFLMFVLNKLKLTNSFATHFAYRTWTRSYDVDLTALQKAMGNNRLLSFDECMTETIDWYVKENIV